MGERRKLFVVSDVHGHCTLLKDALDAAGFDRENESHLLVCCGDYFDRGRENFEVLRFFERLPRAVLLRGNHEDLLLKLLHTGKLQPHHYINGTMATLESFFGKYVIDPVDDSIDFSGKTGTVNRVCAFIDGAVDYFETAHYVFVHGWLPPCTETASGRRAADADAWEAARWVKWTDRYDGTRPLAGKTLVCGHVPTFFATKFDRARSPEDSSIFYGNGLIAIDAGTFDKKRVNVLVLEDELTE